MCPRTRRRCFKKPGFIYLLFTIIETLNCSRSFRLPNSARIGKRNPSQYQMVYTDFPFVKSIRAVLMYELFSAAVKLFSNHFLTVFFPVLIFINKSLEIFVKTVQSLNFFHKKGPHGTRGWSRSWIKFGSCSALWYIFRSKPAIATIALIACVQPSSYFPRATKEMGDVVCAQAIATAAGEWFPCQFATHRALSQN